MKKFLSLLSIGFTIITLFALNVSAETYQLNTQKSKLTWLGKKFTGQHNGTVELKSGTLEIEDGSIKSGSFISNMKTIKVLDIKDPKWNKKLTTHLNSKDFFGTDKFPTSKFVIKKVEKSDKGHNITGDLTIKNTTKTITFPAQIHINGDLVTAKGKATIDRTKFNIKYKSKSFFSDLGDKFIYDDFEIGFDLVANKK